MKNIFRNCHIYRQWLLDNIRRKRIQRDKAIKNNIRVVISFNEKSWSSEMAIYANNIRVLDVVDNPTKPFQIKESEIQEYLERLRYMNRHTQSVNGERTSIH